MTSCGSCAQTRERDIGMTERNALVDVERILRPALVISSKDPTLRTCDREGNATRAYASRVEHRVCDGSRDGARAGFSSSCGGYLWSVDQNNVNLRRDI